MINDTTYTVSKGMEKCSRFLSENGWVSKCHSDNWGGGDWMHGFNGAFSGGFMERLVDNPLFGPFSILAFSIFAILGMLLLVWTIAIKGYALWVAAHRGEKWWFIALLIINTVGILEVIYLVFVAKKKWNLGGDKNGSVGSGDKGDLNNNGGSTATTNNSTANNASESASNVKTATDHSPTHANDNANTNAQKHNNQHNQSHHNNHNNNHNHNNHNHN